MTPVVKALLTDSGSEAANLGVQVLGGHGYMHANGQEQLVRDARITQIYEGTNGVQALDLLGRKVLQLGLLRTFRDPAADFLAKCSDEAALAEFAKPAAAALGLLDDATGMLRQRVQSSPEEVSACAADYMRLFGLTALGYLWVRVAEIALPKSNEEFYRAKLATARFFMQRILPQTTGLHAMILAGAPPVMDLDEASF